MGKGGEATKQKQEDDPPPLIRKEHHAKLKQNGDPGIEDFYNTEKENWHMPRGRAILKAHPEVGKMMGHDWWMKYKVFFAVFVQFMSLELLRGAPFWKHFVCCYTLSGIITGSMTLALHELSHNLTAKKPFWNKVVAMFANATMGIPAAATFKRYHAEHHKFLGEDQMDVDVPTYFEGNTFQSPFMKLIWLFFQPAWYSLRPMVLNAKDPNGYEICNYITIAIVDALVYWRYGLIGVAYLALGTIMGMQWHPIAGHFVAEHYIFNEGQETYSYYGPFNWLGFNVGYHIEHHDLPFIAESKLPQLRRVAHEFYDVYPHYRSWVKVLYDFVCDPHLSPFARMKRKELSPKEFEQVRARGGLT